MNEYTFDYVERNRLDAFCKTVLRNEAINYLSELARRRDREKPLDTLPQAEMDKLCTLDEYPSDSFVFSWDSGLRYRACPTHAAAGR